MYITNKTGTQSLDVPSLSIKRESVGNNMMNNNNFNYTHQPINRSLSCSQLQNNQSIYGNHLPQMNQYGQNRNNYLLPS